ncbi:TcaA NTF2-like domain-containing protein [Bacillus tuaregi]|uniref:TcaA NTF2-like domain-containing protein n=1 Tax=Bacillus tuaregi TaxID=1816695 RepID=UPI0008F92829|nr:zinc-ribbon domain-containing protein [Bacillus tuaregi]
MEMAFCKNCGEPLEESIEFCPACGSPVKEENVTPPNPETIPLETGTNAPIPFKRKVLYSILAAIVLLLIGTHFTISHWMDSDRHLQKIFNAIVDEDGEELFKELRISDGLIYTKSSFATYLKDDNPERLHKDLQAAVAQVKKTGLTEVVTNPSGRDLFRVKTEKFLFFYSKTIIEPISSTLRIDTDLSNAKLTIANQTFPLNGKSLEIKNILPADYDIHLQGKNEFFESEGKRKVEANDFGDHNGIEIKAEDYSIIFAEDPTDSIIFINGKSTNKTAKEIDTLTPVFSDKTEVYGVRQMAEDQTEPSEVVQANRGETVSFIFQELIKAEEEHRKKEQEEAEAALIQKQKAAEHQEIIKHASYVYSDFRNAYENALNYKNFSYVEDYLYGSGAAYTELYDFVYENKDSYYWYRFITNEVKSGEVHEDGVHLFVHEVFTFENHLGEKIKYNRNKEYILIEVSPGKYEIKEIRINTTKKNAI